MSGSLVHSSYDNVAGSYDNIGRRNGFQELVGMVAFLASSPKPDLCGPCSKAPRRSISSRIGFVIRREHQVAVDAVAFPDQDCAVDADAGAVFFFGHFLQKAK